MLRWMLVVGAGTTACVEGETQFELRATSGPVAVGAALRASVVRETCVPDEECTYGKVTIDSVALDPPDVFSYAGSAGSSELVLRALREGTATLTVEATSTGGSKTFLRGLEALTPTNVIVTPTRASTACELPALYAVATTVALPTVVTSNGVVLQGEDLVPVAVDAGTVAADRTSLHEVVIALPDEVRPIAVTSAFDPSFALALETISPAAITSMMLRPAEQTLRVLLGTPITVETYAGDRALCGDSISRTFTIETPNVCALRVDDASLHTLTAAGILSVEVYGLRSGVCTLSVQLGGSSVTATTSLVVTI